MKIGFFLPNATFDLPGSTEVGGIETFSFTVGEALQRLGHEVVLFGGQPKEGRKHRDTTLRLELFDYWETKDIVDLGTRFQRLVQRLHFGWKTKEKWLAENFDIALLAKPFDWPVARSWKKVQPKMKVIMGFHGTDFYLGDRSFYRAVDREFAVSAATAELAFRRIGRRPVVVPNPVDVGFFTPPVAAATPPPAPAPGAVFRLATSGRLVGWKGFTQLVEGIALAKKRGLSLACAIAGDGPEFFPLEDRIKALGLADEVRLLGRLDREELRQFLHSADAYVAPSIGQEAFNIAAGEAAAVGLPLLLSDQVGVASFLSSQDFISYPSREPEALARGIIDLAARRYLPAWSNRTVRHSRVAQLFAPEVVARRIIAL